MLIAFLLGYSPPFSPANLVPAPERDGSPRRLLPSFCPGSVLSLLISITYFLIYSGDMVILLSFERGATTEKLI